MTNRSELRTSDLDYELPPESIARRPAEPRDAARLMIVPKDGSATSHLTVRELPEVLDPGDLLVFNDTAVLPARLVGRKTVGGGRVEGLFLEDRAGAWLVMLRSNGKLREGLQVTLAGEGGASADIELVRREDAAWLVRPISATDEATAAILETIGRTPIPPYIVRSRADAEETIDDDDDRRWYQTVYARLAAQRSVAAPTAGLHFTDELLARLAARGVERAHVTLHVGPGTFKPIETERIDDHPMHQEWYEVTARTLAALRAARERQSRIVAVGTTTVRTLESLGDLDTPCTGDTRLLIRPPHEFRHVDAMMTNFHLPRSTLLALVAAMIGLERTHEVYREAMARGYRFYSYGDAMLVV